MFLRFYHGPKASDGSFKDDYYRQQLLLFYPWRDEDKDFLAYPEESYHEAYDRIIANEENESMKEQMEAFCKRAERVQSWNVEDEENTEAPAAAPTFDDVNLDTVEELPAAANGGFSLRHSTHDHQ